MVWRPTLGELEAEREVVLEEIAMYEDDPQDGSSTCSARRCSATIRSVAP